MQGIRLQENQEETTDKNKTMKPYQKIKQQRAYRKVLAVVSLSALICVSSVYFAFWYETKDAQAQANWVRPEPSAPLSVAVLEWVAAGKIYSWNQYNLEGTFRENTLGPIYTTFATNVAQANAKTQFIAAMKAAFESLKK